MRGRGGQLALALLAGLCAFGARANEQPASRPNVLLIVADDLSPRIGAYGDTLARTPQLDRLAEQGTRFTRAFASAPVCAPSRAAVMMGVHANHFGAGHMRALAGGYTVVPPAAWKAFPELLRAAGYHTVRTGKSDDQLGTRLGGSLGGPFTIWDRDGELGEGLFSDSFELWSAREPGQPFFAWLNLTNVHESQIWPTWQLGDRPLHWLLLPLRLRHHARWTVRTDPARVVVPPYGVDTPTARADLARHYDNVAALDALVGRALAALERAGLAGNTLVVFTSDHGDGLPRAKRWLYDSGLRVPLIVRWPGRVAAGAVSDELVSLVDLAPTLLALAGVPRPPQLEGRVILGEARGPAPDAVFAARDRMDESLDRVRAVRDPRFLYVRNVLPELPYALPNAFAEQLPTQRELRRLHEAGELRGAPALWFRARRPPEELYDTAADPDQIHDLAEEPAYAGELARLRTALDAWLAARTPDLGFVPEAQLRDRFWPGGEQPVTAEPEIAIGGRGDERAVTLRCASDGASIGYRIDDGPFRLYVAPFHVPVAARIEAKAVRYGWRESDPVEAIVR